MNNDGHNDEKSGDRPNELDDVKVLESSWWYLRQRRRSLCLQFCSSKDGYEDCTDANGTEMAGEECLSPCFNIGNDWLQGQHDRNASEEDDHDSNNDKPPRGDAQNFRVVLFPRNDSAK